ncbi:hypothetical protein [Succinimonas sp.]|uniref:hypothetical protein n=1 Tax=Succinimonas sp. TaxID=1936151 RepID=UPI003865BD4F
MISFEDRVSAYPNRYLMIAEDGSTSYVVLERADEPLVAGTPLNAENLNSIVENIFPVTESSTWRGCYFRTVNGETEWLNPPMAELIEYRTVERYRYQPVYVKRVTLTASGREDSSDWVTDGPPVGSKIISLSAVLRYMDGSKEITENLPGKTGAIVQVQPFMSSMFGEEDYPNLDVFLMNAPTGATAEVEIKYVKG